MPHKIVVSLWDPNQGTKLPRFYPWSFQNLGMLTDCTASVDKKEGIPLHRVIIK